MNPKTGEQVSKSKYISVPYYPGLSEEFRKIFQYTQIQVCFKGKNTLKSLLMHPKDKVEDSLKQNVVYKWTCSQKKCDSAYIGETGRTLGERVSEHAKHSTSAIKQHCENKGHPLPSIEQFCVMRQESSQVAREAREATLIRSVNPDLNRCVGKMSIPAMFDDLLGAPKPKPLPDRVASLRAFKDYIPSSIPCSLPNRLVDLIPQPRPCSLDTRQTCSQTYSGYSTRSKRAKNNKTN